MAHAENFFRLKHFVQLYNAGLLIAFLCIMTQHYSLACKVYSLFGQILLSNGKADFAERMYNKLRACAHTAKDTVTKMFAYKQLGYTYIELERYESAMMAFKHMLALAWTLQSFEGEFAAYEGLSKSYLYQGQIDKVKFYDDRITEGEYEPADSQLYKISISSMVTEHPWLKELDKKVKSAKKTRLETA